MYCRKCGAQIDNNARFCGSCGVVVEYDTKENKVAPPSGHTSKKQYKWIGIIACALACVILLTCVIAIFSRKETPETVAEIYMNALMSYDYDVICDYSALDFEKALKTELTYATWTEQEIKDYLLAKYGMTNMKKIFEGPLKEREHENLKYDFGADYIISISISGASELSEAEMYNQIAMFEYYYADSNDLINTEKIKAMCRVRGRLTVEGSEDEDYTAFELYCVKIKGDWKVFSHPSEMIDYSSIF